MNKIIILTIGLVFSITQESIAQRYNWINADYVHDMKNNLPCECMDSISSCFYISMDDKVEKGDDHSVILNYISQMELNYFKVIDIINNRYKISGYNGLHESVTYEIVLEEDTLHLIQEDSSSKFVKSNFYKSIEDDRYLLDNLVLLNKALEIRGYSSIDKVLKIKSKDELHFSCQAWWDDKNLLHVEGEPLFWLLYIEAEHLVIDKVLNPFRGPFSPLETEEVMRMEWNMI